MMPRPGRLLAGAILALAVAAPAADAAPVTVNLRVEGATRTLYEGPATTDALASVSFPSSGGAHACNVRDNTGDPSDPVAPTPFGALYHATQAAGLSLDAGWSDFGGIRDFYVTQVGGDAQDTGAGAYWGFAVNYAEAMVGSCQIPLSGGETVLFAYDYFNKNELLTLTGPRVMNVGEHAQFIVRNGRNNVGVTGATVAGATTTDGVASVSFSGVGIYDLQATKPGALRSNTVRVCVHDGNDGNCGFPNDQPAPAPTPAPTPPPAPVPAPVSPPPAPIAPAPDTTAPKAEIDGVRPGHRYTRRRAPRELRGTIADAGGIQQVELRLKLRRGDRCWGFDGARERFAKTGCKAGADWFEIGGSSEWSYLLPKRLPRGRYVLDVRATDTAGNEGRRDRVRFRVGR